MNYLAHAHLSFGKSAILAGNMISDFVKGKKQYDYQTVIHKGIQLHRAIDTFTDAHPAIKEMKKPFQAVYGLYAGALTDIVCDYFLANDHGEFTSQSQLATFSKATYVSLEAYLPGLPEKFQHFFSYMKKDDWLYNYQFPWMIQKSFAGIAYRAKFMNEADTAFEIFMNNIDAMRPYYTDFFPLLKQFSRQKLHQLLDAG